MDDERAMLERRALYRAREFGHAIPRIEWDARGYEGTGTCTRCGDGVLLYLGSDGASINGTAYESACPSDTCDHGWKVQKTPDGVVCHTPLHLSSIPTTLRIESDTFRHPASCYKAPQ